MDEKKPVRIIVPKDGQARFVYDDQTAEVMTRVGDLTVRRASHVDQFADLPEDAQNWLICRDVDNYPKFPGWWASLLPVGGPVLGPFKTHAEAIAAELAWLHEHSVPVVKETP